MKHWTKPEATEMRWGFEITFMYVTKHLQTDNQVLRSSEATPLLSGYFHKLNQISNIALRGGITL